MIRELPDGADPVAPRKEREDCNSVNDIMALEDMPSRPVRGARIEMVLLKLPRARLLVAPRKGRED